MEKNRSLTTFVTPHVAATAEVESDKDSSDSENEENIAIPNNTSTFTITNLPETGESSSSNINLSPLQTNNVILTTSSNNSVSETTRSSNMNTTDVNNFVVTSTAPPSTLNPMLMNLVFIPPPPLYFIPHSVANQNQCAIRESSIMNDAHNNNNAVVFPTIITSSTADTVYNAHETLTCSDKEKRVNSDVNTTVSEGVLRSNTATINSSSDRSPLSTTNIRNEEREFNPCNDSDVHNNVSSTTDGVEQNCDSSINSAEVKTDDTVKREPLDIQSMLNQLEDGFVCQIFDIEDPFLVIEISSDGFTDDDES